MLKTAADLMQTRVITIGPRASLEELSLMLEEEGVHGVPVVDSSGLPVGVVSRTDLVEAQAGGTRGEPTSHYYAISADDLVWEEDADAEADVDFTDADGDSVGDIMSTRLVTAKSTATAGQLARLMTRERIHRLLITEGKQLVGIVSISDLVRCVGDYERALTKLGATPRPAKKSATRATSAAKKAPRKATKTQAKHPAGAARTSKKRTKRVRA